MTDGRRPKRVAELLRAELTALLIRQIEDPRLSSLVVTDVFVPDDLSSAHVKVRLMVGDDDPKLRSSAVDTLRKVSPRLRRSIGPRLGLRRVPELRFTYDDGHDAARRVEELLREIAAEQAGSSES
jgi:ribosome-binding factor A